jgi:hypothetical protein
MPKKSKATTIPRTIWAEGTSSTAENPVIGEITPAFLKKVFGKRYPSNLKVAKIKKAK